MIDRNDRDFIKDLFDEDGLKAPDSLSAENIMQKLDPAPKKKKPVTKQRWFRPVIAVAACAALAVGIIPVMQSADPGNTGDVEQISSYSELNGKIKEMIDSSGQVVMNYGLSSSGTGSFDAKSEDALMSEDAEVSESAGGSSESHSETYNQVRGVDEADIVKTDGKCIYYSSYIENQVIIARARNGKAKRISAIGSAKIGDTIEDMYVNDGRLTVIGSCYGEANETFGGKSFDRQYTTVTVFDISDPSDPQQLSQYSQTGDLLSSRMIDGILCLVTNDYIYSYRKNHCIPYVSFDGEEPARLDVGDICCIKKAVNPAYTVIGCIDTTTGKAHKDKVKTKAILGGSSEIYCSRDTLYVTADVSERTLNGDFYDYDSKTCILKVSLKGGKVKYKKTATIDGNVNNQFSMDESDGYFKIAVTDDENGQDTNDLYIMDENMKEVGSVKNFAPGEHIEAVRYIKNKAYVITYEQTDPLFIIDLADPEDPVIEGHVKISGFSTLLVPSGKNHLLGLGFSTESTEFGEATDGVKLSLFDISDPAAPQVTDAKEYPGMYSEVQYNHKALLVGPDDSYYAIPFERWGTDTDDDSQGILLFSVKSGKLTGFHTYETAEPVKRCIYIGSYLYGVCDDDLIRGFKVQ